MPADESLIVKVIHEYYPDWDPPRDNGNEWMSCLCPFHGESRPSATVSYENDAFACFACGEKGDALAIIMRKEEIGYLEALDFAERISPGSNDKVRSKPTRKPRRRTFGSEGTQGGRVGNSEAVPPRIRGRSSPWS